MRTMLFMFGLFSLVFVLDGVLVLTAGKGLNLDSATLGIGIGVIGLLAAAVCSRLDQRVTRIEKVDSRA